MKYNIVESGSQGNATIIEEIVMIDCGISFKKVKPFMNNLKLVLLTHIHSDHFNKSTIKRLAQERPTLRFGCQSWLVKALIDCSVDKSNIDVYDSMNYFVYSDNLKIKTFNLTHDVPNCGYVVYLNGGSYFYATDTCNLDNVKEPNCDMYFIEANYLDKQDLENRKQKHIENGEFYYEDRVEKTHMSQVQALDWLMENMGSNSKYEFMHIHKEKEESSDKHV